MNKSVIDAHIHFEAPHKNCLIVKEIGLDKSVFANAARLFAKTNYI